VPPTAFNEAGVQALPFIISANKASRTQITLLLGLNPGWPIQEQLLLRGGFTSAIGKTPMLDRKRPALLSVTHGKEIDRRRILPFYERISNSA